jgi:hypothetical protein
VGGGTSPVYRLYRHVTVNTDLLSRKVGGWGLLPYTSAMRLNEAHGLGFQGRKTLQAATNSVNCWPTFIDFRGLQALDAN